jgi:hypothetical protein
VIGRDSAPILSTLGLGCMRLIEQVIGSGAADRGFALRMGLPFLEMEIGPA